jgi:hypothetical protein
MCKEGYVRVVKIRCFGRSTKPSKDLLHEVKGFRLNEGLKTTKVHRFSIKNESGQ